MSKQLKFSSRFVYALTLSAIPLSVNSFAAPPESATTENIAPTDSKRDTDVAVSAVKAIYAKTKTAKTAKDFSALVGQCESTSELVADQSDQLKNDLQRLLAWTLCKRGQERLDLAISLRSAGNPEQFEAVLKAALADFDRSLKTDDGRWKTFFSRSIAVENLGRTDEAIRDLNSAIELNSKSTKAYFNRAELLNWKGDAASAINDYKVVLQSAPKDVQAIQGLAHAHLALGQHEKAIELYTRVTKLQPTNRIAWQARGEAHQLAKNWKAANEDFAKSISIGKSAQGFFQAAWFHSTCPDPDFFEPITAMEYARQGKQYDPDSVQSLEVLAAASAANGQFDDAVELQKQAIKKTATVQSDYQFDTDEMKVRLSSYEQEEPYLQVK